MQVLADTYDVTVPGARPKEAGGSLLAILVEQALHFITLLAMLSLQGLVL